MKQVILERTGDSNWHIKHMNLNDTPERSAAWIKSLKCGSDAENNVETTDNE